jgi:hypothetical protein
MSEMQAGPELDAKVAEKVMGWKREQAPRGTPIWRWQDRLTWESVNGYRPSLSISDAWGVVARLNRLGWSVSVHERTPYRGADECLSDCILERYPDDEGAEPIRVSVSADTAPLAISRAALQATEQDGGTR